ncbi:MAG TPA: acyltransferase domain-containing protein [Pseudonocardiaceae bacterium]|nr:acyltransferase domain-containing protein [Pseudonocardiaceae bacterium]
MANSMARVREPERILRLAAGSRDELLKLLAAATPDSSELVDGGPAFRLGIVDPTAKRLTLARKVVDGGKHWRGRNDVWFSPAPLLTAPGAGIAFLFPGLEADFAPQIADVADWLGVPTPKLDDSSIGRHAESLSAVGRLLARALGKLAVRPDAVAGHSVGEWVAMIVGGIFSGTEFDEMLTSTDLDAIRVPGVQFAVLGCGVDQVSAELAGRAGLVISHDNSTNQTIACGPDAAIAELVDTFREQGTICQILPFRSGFHTPTLKPYLAAFEAGVPSLRIADALMPVWSATTARPFPADTEAIRRLCVRHLLEPVRFRDTVKAMYAAGTRVFVQVGAGQLGSLIDDTLADVEHLTVAANSAHRGGIDQLRRLATALWVEGATPDFDALEPGNDVLRLIKPIHIGHTASAPAMPATSVSGVGVAEPLIRLRELGTRLPVAREFAALLDDVAGSVATVLDASSRTVRPSVVGTSLSVSTATMPYLLDHCFVPQRADWPSVADRRPVMPATTILAQLMELAEKNAQGQLAVGVEDLRFDRWLVAEPAVEVAVQVRRVGPDRMRVALGDYAEGVVLLGRDYPADITVAWQLETDERAPALSADALYRQRWMFHGRQFQVITASTAISDGGIRGELTVPTAPGALLDGVGQLLGQWLVETHPARWIAFPIRIRQVRQHAAVPPAGTRVACSVRVRALTEDTVEADARLTCGGRPLMSISGWCDRRFDSAERGAAVHRFPEHNTLSEQRAGGWWLMVESSPSLASREFYLRKYLGGPEHQEYEDCAPRERREWLLRRIVIKDAVRGWLWEHGFGPVFPAEIAVGVDDSGHTRVTGRHGLLLPGLSVAVAASQRIAVALVAETNGSGPRNAIQLVETLAAAGSDRDTVSEVVRRRLIERLHVETGRRPSSPVHTEAIADPAGLPARRYVVAWTSGE